MKAAQKQIGRPIGSGTGPARELTAEEIKRLWKVVQSPRDRALLGLLLGCGLRVGECTTLTRKHVSSRTHVLLERHSTKSKKSRRVPLGGIARKHLTAYLADLPDASASAPLFPGRSGRALNVNYMTQHVADLLDAAGIQDASSHSFRRTFANALRRNGVDIAVISLLLGHSSIAVTGRYLGAAAIELEAAVASLPF